MERIFTQLKNRINNITSPDASAKSWDQFQKYRERRNSNSRWATYWPWILGSLGMFLLFSNISIITDRYQLKKQISAISNDTIYITKYITEKQTRESTNKIILSQIEYQAFKDQQKDLAALQIRYRQLNADIVKLNQGMESLKAENGNLQLALVQSHLKGKSLLDDIQLKTKISSTIQTELDKTEDSKSDIERISLDHLAFLDLKMNPLPIDNKVFRSPRPWIDPFKKKRDFNFLEAIRPKAFSIDLNGGVLDREPTHESSIGFHYGASGLVAFSSHFRLKLGVKSWIILSRLEDDIQEYPDLPQVTAPEDGTLKEIKINTTGLAFSGNAEYMFSPFGRIRPFIGAGWLEQVDQKTNYKFEFNTPDGELYLTKETYYTGPNQHFFTITLGSDFNIHKRIDAYLAIQYAREVNGNESEYLFFQPGLYFHF